MFKNLTNLAGAMKNLSQMGTQMKAINAKLEAAKVYGSATSDGKAVNVEMSGLGIMQSVSISEGLLTADQKSLLETLTRDSVNQAMRAAKEMHVASLKELTGGVELFPGLNDMLENMAK